MDQVSWSLEVNARVWMRNGSVDEVRVREMERLRGKKEGEVKSRGRVWIWERERSSSILDREEEFYKGKYIDCKTIRRPPA